MASTTSWALLRKDDFGFRISDFGVDTSVVKSAAYRFTSSGSSGLRKAFSPKLRTKVSRQDGDGLQGIRLCVSPPRKALRASFSAAALYASTCSGVRPCA